MTKDKWYSLSGPWIRISVIIIVNLIIDSSLGSFSAPLVGNYGYPDIASFITTLFSVILEIFTLVAFAGFYRDLCNRYEGRDLLDRLK